MAKADDVVTRASGPRVAVLLATYNGAAYLRDFLDSLRAQSLSDFTLFVRDDGSTDSTLAVLAEHGGGLAIRLLPSSGRLGPARGFFAIMQAAGDDYDVYLFADQDDWWYADKIDRAVQALRARMGRVALYCTRLEYVDEKLAHIRYSPTPRLLCIENAAVQNVATGCTVAITAAVRQRVLDGKPHDFVMHDWWLYLFCTAFGEVIYDPEPSIKYRQHGGNAIGAATGVIEDLRRRLVRFSRREGGVHRLSDQIRAFLACHGTELDARQRQLLAQIVTARHSLRARLRMAIRPPFARQSRFDNLVLRVFFLLGRY